MDIEHFQQVLGLQHGTAKTTEGSEVFFYHRNVVDCQPDATIHVLIHGYPQS